LQRDKNGQYLAIKKRKNTKGIVTTKFLQNLQGMGDLFRNPSDPFSSRKRNSCQVAGLRQLKKETRGRNLISWVTCKWLFKAFKHFTPRKYGQYV